MSDDEIVTSPKGFVSKQPKRKRHRIVDDSKCNNKREKVSKKKTNEEKEEKKVEEVQELTKEEENEIVKAKLIFGEQLEEILQIIDSEPNLGQFTYVQKISLLNSMFAEATRNKPGDDVTNFPAFLVYAKRIFSPNQMQELSVLCAKRLNSSPAPTFHNIRSNSTPDANKFLKPNPISNQQTPSSTSPKKRSKLRRTATSDEPNLTHELNESGDGSATPSPRLRPKPKRGASLKNFFDKLIVPDSDGTPSRSSVDFTQLAPRLFVLRPAASESTSQLFQPNSPDKPLKKSSRSAFDLQPLFDNQVQHSTDWSLVDPKQDGKVSISNYQLELMVRLFDFKYEYGKYPTGDLSSVVTIDQFWLDEPIYENNFYTKV